MNSSNLENPIVFTDLDGTLLDHDNYSWDSAADTLQKLNNANIPVIYNTSKTQAELRYWRQQTNNHHPFIVENGSAIYIPNNYCVHNPSSSEGEDQIIQLGIKRTEILTWLSDQCQSFTGDFIHFAQLCAEELVNITNLPAMQAELALQREYSEALQWIGDEEKKSRFIRHAQNSGYKVLIGGRFLHVLGNTNKGLASQTLCEHLLAEQLIQAKQLTTIACGDSDNDIDMLEWANLAILVRSIHRDFPAIDNTNRIQTKAIGPEGWAEALDKLLFNKNVNND